MRRSAVAFLYRYRYRAPEQNHIDPGDEEVRAKGKPGQDKARAYSTKEFKMHDQEGWEQCPSM
jgi:hypothetical protein